MNLPAQLTDEQREQLLRTTAQVAAGFQAIAVALLPAIEVATAQFRQLYGALQAAGLLDEDGQPPHIGNRANAEDCPACAGTNPDYPFICPGP